MHKKAGIVEGSGGTQVLCEPPMLRTVNRNHKSTSDSPNELLLDLQPLPPPEEREAAEAAVSHFASRLDALKRVPSYHLAVEASGNATSAFARVWSVCPLLVKDELKTFVTGLVANLQRFTELLEVLESKKPKAASSVRGFRTRATIMIEALKTFAQGRTSEAVRVASALHGTEVDPNQSGQ